MAPVLSASSLHEGKKELLICITILWESKEPDHCFILLPGIVKKIISSNPCRDMEYKELHKDI